MYSKCNGILNFFLITPFNHINDSERKEIVVLTGLDLKKHFVSGSQIIVLKFMVRYPLKTI